MHPINLLYVITKLELGGAQTQLLNLIGHLDKTKFRLFLFTARDGVLIKEASSIPGLTLKKSRCLGRRINPFRDLLALIEICWFIKKNDIDIVHTHSSKAGILGRWAARLARVEVIIHTVHGWSFNVYQSNLRRLFFIWLERLAAQFTDKLIVVSNYDQREGLDNRIGSENKYALIRYGIDYAKFNLREKSIRSEFGIGTEDLLVGMVACFKPQKAPQDFIKLAFSVKQTMPHVKFILVGDGVLRPDIERLIERLQLQQQIILTGWRRDIPRLLSALDIFLLTSLWEGLPIAVLEAMASSKPVISTQTGGVGEIVVEGKSGFLALPHDTNKLAQNLIVLLKDEGLRIRIGENARQALDSHFALSTMVESHKNLYADLMNRKETRYAN
jgi:glycosyltransferase involved in cell wall biosynthesis